MNPEGFAHPARAPLLFGGSSPRLALLCAVGVLASCATIDTGSVVHTRAVAILGCDEVEVEQLGAYRYRAQGCGDTITLACTAAALEPECLPESTRAASEPEEEEPIADGAAPEAEAQIRAGLDARKDDVLACAGAERVAVRAAYAPDGSVEITLQGALRGSAEERCVQEALDGVRVPASDRAGVVVHLVH
jgi:hypothetical protein